VKFAALVQDLPCTYFDRCRGSVKCYRVTAMLKTAAEMVNDAAIRPGSECFGAVRVACVRSHLTRPSHRHHFRGVQSFPAWRKA